MSVFPHVRPAPRPAIRRIRYDLLAQRLLLGASILAVWWLCSLRISALRVARSAARLRTFRLKLNNGDLWTNLSITLERVTIGFVLATIVSVPFGIMLGAIKPLGEFFEPVLPVLNTVSSQSWRSCDHLVRHLNATTIFVVFMTAMPLIITNVWQGTRSVNAEFIELAQTLRMPKWKVMTKIYLPTIMPYFFSGARLAFGFGWR
jgi:NitT/TauT family transport system permease protein